MKEQTPIQKELNLLLEQGIITDSMYNCIIRASDSTTKAKVLEVLNDLQFNIKGLTHDEIYWLIDAVAEAF